MLRGTALFQHLVDPKTETKLQNNAYRRQRITNLLALATDASVELPINRDLFNQVLQTTRQTVA